MLVHHLPGFGERVLAEAGSRKSFQRLNLWLCLVHSFSSKKIIETLDDPAGELTVPIANKTHPSVGQLVGGWSRAGDLKGCGLHESRGS